MHKTCLENFIVYWKSGFKCYLCRVEIQENNLYKHVESQNHRTMINRTVNGRKKTNRIANIDQIKKIHQSELVYNKIIYKDNNDLFCYICNCQLSSLSSTRQHINSLHHQTKYNELKATERERIKNNENQVNHITKQYHDKEKAIDYITYNPQKQLFTCTVCNVPIASDSLMQHIQSSFHKNILTAIDNKTNNKLTNKSINENVSIQTKQKRSSVIGIRYCKLCKIYLENIEILQLHSMIHLYKQLNDSWDNFDIISCKFKKNKPIVKCLLCNYFIPCEEKKASIHFSSFFHLSRLKFFFHIQRENIVVKDLQINAEQLEGISEASKYTSKASLCKSCDVTVLSISDINSHCGGKKHQNNELQYLQNITNKSFNQESIPDIAHFYKCYLCEKSFLNFAELLNHYNEKEHKLKKTCFNLIDKSVCITFSQVKGQSVVNCSLCKKDIPSCRNALEHIAGKLHKFNENKTLPTNIENSNADKHQNANTKEILTPLTKTTVVKPVTAEKNPKNLCETSVNRVLVSKNDLSNPSDMETILNQLISLSISNNDKKMIKNKPQTFNTKFNANVYNFGMHYIKYCINPGKHNIYNISSEEKHLLKLGSSLICPLDSEIACIACGEQLSNEKTVFEHFQSDNHKENLLEMERLSREFEDHDGQFSDLKLAKNYLQEESDSDIYCYACKSKVKNDDENISLHIKKSDHIAKSQLCKRLSNTIYNNFSNILNEIWYFAEKFICNICKVKYDMEIDFIKHLESPAHLKNVPKCLQNGNIAKFGICPVCITFWYADSKFYNEHCQNPFHKRFTNKGDFQVPLLTDAALNLIDQVDEQIEYIRSESNAVFLEKHSEIKLLKAIEETVKTIYTKAKAYIFGSRLSHLGFIDSDVDVFLDCDNVYYSGITPEKCQNYLNCVKKVVEKQPDVWIIDEVLLCSRVPIIKLRHIPVGLKCDISFANGLSVEKSKLIRYYNEAYGTCREMILYLKKWLSFCRITGSDGITTFAISWYVIFYLQIQGILPSVHDLIQRKQKSRIVDGWECGFLDNFSANHSDLNLRNHLKGFFNYYAEFNYKNHVVCPYLGKIQKKEIFINGSTLPTEMLIYKRKLQKDYLQMFRFDSPMCIQDPIDLSQNITKAVKKYQLRCFRKYCFESAARC